MIAVDLIAAAKSGDQTKFAEYDKKWDANADDIASFLSGAKPNWPRKDVTDLLYLHLKLTKGEVVSRLTEGTQLVAMNSNNAYPCSDESYSKIMEIAEERGYNFPYLNDEDQSIAKNLGPLVTLYVFAFDRELRIKYREE
jgi:hypothetical protein